MKLLTANIAKIMTSNGKQFTVTREMLTAVARDQSVLLKVAWCCRWNVSAFFKIAFVFITGFDPFVLLYNKSLNDWSLGEQRILFPFVSGNKIHCSPRVNWDLSMRLTFVKLGISVEKKSPKWRLTHSEHTRGQWSQDNSVILYSFNFSFFSVGNSVRRLKYGL